MSGADWLQGSWSDDNRIVYDTWNDGLRVLDADGGSPRVLTQPKGEWHLAPRMLPGSTRLLFFVQTASEFRIESLTLDDPNRQTVLDNASHPTYLASGHLLFVRDGALMVAPFDVDSLQVTGSPRPIELGALVDHVNVAAPTRQLAVSLNGTLVYAPSPESVRTETSLVWVDRQGRAEDFARVPFAQPHFRFSSDGQKLIISGRGTPQARYDVLDVTRRTLTPFYAATSDYPTGALWSADGERLYLPNFGTHVSQLLERSADGGLVEVLFEVEGTWLTPAAVTDDDRYIVFFFYQPETAGDIWYFDRQAPEGQRLHPFAAEAGSQYHPALSPDGKWLAYASTGSEGTRVYVRRFPEGDALTAVAPDNGWAPIWAPDGSELYFTSIGHDELIVVPVDIGAKPTFGKPRRLPLDPYQDSADVGISWAVHPDGKKFLFAVQEYDPTLASRLVVVQNWFGDLERLFEP